MGVGRVIVRPVRREDEAVVPDLRDRVRGERLIGFDRYERPKAPFGDTGSALPATGLDVLAPKLRRLEQVDVAV